MSTFSLDLYFSPNELEQHVIYNLNNIWFESNRAHICVFLCLIVIGKFVDFFLI